MVKFATLASLAGTIVSARAAAATVPFDGLTNTQIRNVRSRLLESSKASWEIGTAVQALLELDTPSHGVFGKATIPPPARLNNTSEVLRYAGRIVDSKVSDSMTLMVDGAAGDPASIGVAVLLANFTEGTHTKKYAEAAQSQLHWLLDVVPRAANGAISHRNEQNQNWADFVSMVPPFLAYFGAITQDRGLLQQGYDQVRLYRDILRVTDGDFTGTVHHVINGDWSDPGIWATGQGWFAYGAIRVAQTLKLSSFSGSFKKEQADLLAWADEIITATYKHVNEDGSFNNYLDQTNQFQEMASTAIVAAATFRLATITGKPNNIEAATKAFRLVKDKIDEDGWLQNVVNPYNFHDPGEHSPESQAFTLQLQAAWSEYKASITPLPSIANVANVGNIANVASEPPSERPNLGAVSAGTYSIPKSALGMRKRSARHMRNMAASSSGH